MIDKDYAKTLVGKHVFVLTRQGAMIDGILDRLDGDKIYLRAPDGKAQVKFTPFFNPFIPLVLFDLLAIGTSPFGFGGGFGGFPFFI